MDSEVSERVVRRVVEDFAPQLIEEVSGLVAYYILDAQNGSFATITLCESRAVLDDCSKRAAEWVTHYMRESILNKEDSDSFLVEVGPTLQGLLHMGASTATDIQFSQKEEAQELADNELVTEAPDSQSQELLSPAEVSQELGMGKSWVYERIRSGEIPSIKLGHNLKVRRSELEEYLDKHRGSPAQ